jgi:hypothetical protein
MGEALLLCGLGAFAYYQMFSVFRAYDDEGYMMLIVKHFLAGHRLYDEVSTWFGPTYFVYKSIVHRVLALPLTHDVVRLTAIATWLATGFVAATATVSLTRSLPLAAVVQFVVTIHLATIANEPGHPQELVGFLIMSMIAWFASGRADTPRRTLAGAGVIVAALTMLKVNVGLFAALGVWMAVVSLLPLTAAGTALRVLSAVAAIAMPGLLMRARLAQPLAWHFAATETLSIAAVAALALTRRTGSLSSSALAVFVSAVIAGVALIGAATLATGTTLGALADCLVAAPLRIPALYAFMPLVYVAAPTPAALGLALGLGVRLTWRSRVNRHVVSVAQLVFGCVVLYASWRHDVVCLALLLRWLTPFLWLVIAPAPEDDARVPLARLALCWLAVLGPLQAYPVAGSQISFGTVLHVLVGALCVHDGLRWLRTLSAVLDHRALRLATAAATLVGVALLTGWHVVALRRQYLAQVPLDLPGATRLRLSSTQVDDLRTLVDTVREHSDTFICLPGFGSLYFWTGEEPPTLDVFAEQIRFLSDERQAAMVDALLAHPRPMIVDFPALAPPPVEARLRERFELLTSVGGYQLLVPR